MSNLFTIITECCEVVSFRQKIRKNFSYFAKESTSAPRKSFQAAKERHNNVQMNLTTVVLGYFYRSP